MCTQCHNKKMHVHSVKPVGNQTSVRVEQGASCCTETTVVSTTGESGGCCSGGSGGDPEDSDPAGRTQTASLIAETKPSSLSRINHLKPSRMTAEAALSVSVPFAKSSSQPSATHATSPASDSSQPKFSWQIQGMDCPSCAGKLEKAILAVRGVESATVTFATEKLFVTGDSDTLMADVESAAKATGFPLIRPSQGKAAETGRWIQTYGMLTLTAVMIFVSYLISLKSESFGLAAFTATTLVGLVPIARKAFQLAKRGSPFSIETLMSVAALGALYLGETAEAAMVLLLFLLGEQLEGYASARARSGVKALMALVPETARRVEANGDLTEVPADQLRPGDIIEVAPGARLPADAVLQDPTASFDESAMTGESLPVERLAGDTVLAGSLSVEHLVRLKVTSEPGENAIDRILHLIENAEASKAPIERFIDRFSRWYTPAMILLAALIVLIPTVIFGQSWDEWLYKGLTLLLIACPCALVISTPAAITSGLAAAARRGALIKGGAALEQLGQAEVIAFDKTGTLTQGKPQVTDILAWEGTESELLAQSAAVEMGSLHPLASAVIERANQHGIKVPQAELRKALPGRGVQGQVGGKVIQLLAPDRLDRQIVLTTVQQQAVDQLSDAGKTLVVVLRDDQPVGLIAWRDNLREDAKQAVQRLKNMGVNSLMLTGDNPRAATAIASEVGMDFRAGLLPEDKVREVAQWSQNHRVAMVGDGINDAPAMKMAHVGVAMGSGTDVALETADAALTHNRLSELPEMILLSRKTLANIRQNISLALGLKLIFLVTTLLGWTGLWLAVLADSGATALVTVNALRLLRFKPESSETDVSG
ncbi:zinc/cadmium/mercury/lead-transporting ATPase [Photobacterium sp. 1_MG-2023]|uniref:zinc/cadmium/mercury/lead-transporting ATPase n=1 Tax=Photobacterium sp. 1_MG-2023 TaxID=3062646 RepID=UPI0026E3D140|nr:zinc/cadmium/mercury/lead-transporting ATPase [Photobacterium sp. 1_MG-2023]MDO6705009.1 zinc/cadmium/mercury/lead-transporting ATPase [Photobacterium sp. 1_MG-2023]